MSNSSNDLPAPLQLILGLCQLAFGFVIGGMGIAFRVLPVTAWVAGPFVTIGTKLSYDGGHNTTLGIMGTFGLIFRGSKSAIKGIGDKSGRADTDKLFPPPK